MSLTFGKINKGFLGGNPFEMRKKIRVLFRRCFFGGFCSVAAGAGAAAASALRLSWAAWPLQDDTEAVLLSLAQQALASVLLLAASRLAGAEELEVAAAVWADAQAYPPSRALSLK